MADKANLHCKQQAHSLQLVDSLCNVECASPRLVYSGFEVDLHAQVTAKGYARRRVCINELLLFFIPERKCRPTGQDKRQRVQIRRNVEIHRCCN